MEDEKELRFDMLAARVKALEWWAFGARIDITNSLELAAMEIIQARKAQIKAEIAVAEAIKQS